MLPTRKKKKKERAKKRNSHGKKDDEGGMLPEERAYKRSLRQNRKEHAKKVESEIAVRTNLGEKGKKEEEEKRRLKLMHGPLPEELAYRMSIGQQPDAYLDPATM